MHYLSLQENANSPASPGLCCNHTTLYPNYLPWYHVEGYKTKLDNEKLLDYAFIN